MTSRSGAEVLAGNSAASASTDLDARDRLRQLAADGEVHLNSYLETDRALGARPDTFGGLACFGDLLGAVAGSDRPEFELGGKVSASEAVRMLMVGTSAANSRYHQPR